MKYIIYLIALVSISCSKKLPIDSDLTEEEVYEFMNTTYIKECVKSNYECTIYPMPIQSYDRSWVEIEDVYSRELKPDLSNLISFDSFIWDGEKLPAFSIVDTVFLTKILHGEINSNSQNFTEKWNSQYGKGFTAVSLPMYSKQHNLLLLREYHFNSDWDCGTSKNHIYYYKKDSKNKWVKI